MSAKIQSVKGMNDILPSQSPTWQSVETVLRKVAELYAYQEIRTPVLEKTTLFRQALGEATDIIEKEMYAFEDAGGEHLCMRPENTASVVRAGIQHGLFYHNQIRLWYMGPMFRRDRPQKGRYRQFSQFGMEAIGWPNPEIDAEIIMASAKIWGLLGLQDIRLCLNTLGSNLSRERFKEALVTYLSDYKNELDVDSQRRLKTNPLRILDSKNQRTQDILNQAPQINDFIDSQESDHFAHICDLLTQSSIAFHIDASLVRGLDYYTSTVFEWVTDANGAQNAICGGGRYDGLIALHGGANTPACGFALGLDRLVECYQAQQHGNVTEQLDIYLITLSSNDSSLSTKIGESLRNAGYKTAMNHGAGKLKSQLKKANANGAKIALILGESESTQGVIQVKPLRGQGETQNIATSNLLNFIETNQLL